MIKTQKTISCIIPAYNEGARIDHVLAVVHKHPCISEIIVVDDGSHDDTATHVSKYEGIRLIKHETNKGKSKAIYTGIKASTGNYIFFLDADLVGLSKQNVSDLLNPVLRDDAEVTISLRSNAPRIWHWLDIDYISGERVFPKNVFFECLDRLPSLKPFGLEVFLNRLMIRNRYRIEIVDWPNVRSPFKEEKYGFWTGLRGDIGMFRDIFATVGVLGPIFQIYDMRKLMITDKRPMAKHSISIVVPAFNESAYIEECLKSILRELEGRAHVAEVIVVNNASTDNTEEVVNRFPNVKHVFEPNKGLTYARQRGLKEASGDFVAYVDADTRMPVGWLAYALHFFHEHPRAVCLSGPARYFDATPMQKLALRTIWTSTTPVYLLFGYMVYGANFIAKKDALIAAGGFDTSIAFWGEDTDIAKRLKKQGDVTWRSDFYINTSSRRYLKQGILWVNYQYAINYLWQAIFHRSFNNAYVDIRIDDKKTEHNTHI